MRTQTPDRMVQPKRTAEEMFPLVEQYNERTQSAAAFCAKHGISYGQLNYWRRKVRQETAAEDSRGFVEIGSVAPREAAQVEIAYPGGIRVRFFAPVSASYLARLTQS